MRAKILACAGRLFRKHGYGGTSIEAVAAAAGVSKRSLYARFPTKARLFEAVVESAVRAVVDPPIPLPTGASLEQSLELAAQRLLSPGIRPTAWAIYQATMLGAEPKPELAAAIRQAGLEPLVRWADDLLGAFGIAEADRDKRLFLAERFFSLIVTAAMDREGHPLTGPALPRQAGVAPRQSWPRLAWALELFAAGCRGHGTPPAFQAEMATELRLEAPLDR